MDGGFVGIFKVLDGVWNWWWVWLKMLGSMRLVVCIWFLGFLVLFIKFWYDFECL